MSDPATVDGRKRFRESLERDEGQQAIRQGGELWNDLRAEANAEEQKCKDLSRSVATIGGAISLNGQSGKKTMS